MKKSRTESPAKISSNKIPVSLSHHLTFINVSYGVHLVAAVKKKKKHVHAHVQFPLLTRVRFSSLSVGLFPGKKLVIKP